MALGGLELTVGDAAGPYSQLMHGAEDTTQIFLPNRAVICKTLLKHLTVFS